MNVAVARRPAAHRRRAALVGAAAAALGCLLFGAPAPAPAQSLETMRVEWARLALPPAGAALPAPMPADPRRSCAESARSAEQEQRLPPGLLLAIGRVESGRPDPVTHEIIPWPWTVQAGDRGLYFATKREAVRWVRAAQQRGESSLDVGCFQINLHFHGQAFRDLDEAFDPQRNAGYAARLLRTLYETSGRWDRAIGFYHSQTAALAGPYEARVQRALPAAAPPDRLSHLRAAWQATLPPSSP